VPPVTILTSNRTRDLHDAVKRRCLYHWLDYPERERELAIVQAKVPEAAAALTEQIARFVDRLRSRPFADAFERTPGIAESVEWAKALVALDTLVIDPEPGARDGGHFVQAARRRGGAHARASAAIAGARCPAEGSATAAASVSWWGDARSGKLPINLLGFGRALRRAGLAVDAERLALARKACCWWA
jgi:MoxR-like ATPase